MNRMSTTVRNIKDGTYDPTNPDHKYIGRPMRFHKVEAIRNGSKWGSPTQLRKGATPRERAAVIEWYRDVYLPSQHELLAALSELAGKTLYCFCKPLACHGDVLRELADREQG